MASLLPSPSNLGTTCRQHTASPPRAASSCSTSTANCRGITSSSPLGSCCRSFVVSSCSALRSSSTLRRCGDSRSRRRLSAAAGLGPGHSLQSSPLSCLTALTPLPTSLPSSLTTPRVLGIPMMLPALPERDFTFREGVGFQIVAEGKRRGRRVRAVAAEPLAPAVAGEPQLVATSATAFAPATVANLGPGFDFLGCAVEGLGDHVTAEVRDDLPRGALVISRITGDGGRLSMEAKTNCIGVAAQATLELLGVSPGGKGTHKGIALSLEKGLPLGSGLGSSAASAAAAAVAVNALFGSPLTKAQLVLAGLQSEAFVSGYHADNVAPSLMGGFVLVRSYQPELDLIPLVYPRESELLFVVVSPAFEAPTRKMRAALPTEISMKCHVANSSQAAALVAAIILGDASLLGAALASDSIVEPRRAPLIPGMSAVKVAAKAAGAYGCTISGAGPTAVAVTDSVEKAEAIGAEMVRAFREQGKLQAVATVAPLNREGARVLRVE